jgi:hypothetical protein
MLDVSQEACSGDFREDAMFRFAIVAAILVMAAVISTQRPANAATFCAQHVGASPERDCSFTTLKDCRAAIRAKGGGRCYRKHG